jgi:mono/diheme cytochrome c family protein
MMGLRRPAILNIFRMTRHACVGLALASCDVGDPLTTPGGDAPSATIDAKATFKQVALPLLKTAACAGCHASSSQPLFMAGVDDDAIYATIVASQVVNFATPSTSRLISKGQHEGRAFTPSESASILSWLNAEDAAR